MDNQTGKTLGESKISAQVKTTREIQVCIQVKLKVNINTQEFFKKYLLFPGTVEPLLFNFLITVLFLFFLPFYVFYLVSYKIFSEHFHYCFLSLHTYREKPSP